MTKDISKIYSILWPTCTIATVVKRTVQQCSRVFEVVKISFPMFFLNYMNKI